MNKFERKPYEILKPKSKYLLILLLVLVSSCSSNSSKENKSNEILVFGNIKESYKASQFIEDLSFTALETNENCLIGDATKLIKTDDRYYIFDGISKKFLVFSHSGEYMYSFGKLGRGPGEYSRMVDFTFDRNRDYIIILDNDRKIIKTDLLGNFLTESSLPAHVRFRFNSIHVFNGSLYAYTGQNSANEKQYQVIRFDEDLKPVEYLFPYDFPFPAIRTFGNALYTFNNDLNFVSEWSFKIYRMKGANFEERFSLNLDGKELSLEGITLDGFIGNKTGSYLFNTCVEGDDVIYLPIFTEGRPMYGFLEKRTNKFYLIKDIINDSLVFLPPGSYANNKFISLISSLSFNQKFPNNNLKLRISDNPVIIEYKMNFRDEK